MTDNEKLMKDEREALAQAIRDSLGVTPETIAAGHQRPGNTDDLARDLIARGFGFRRSEHPEPSDTVELIERSSLGTPDARALRATVSDEKAAELVAEAHRRSEPQGEPSDARAKVIDALVMTRLSDFAGTDMGVIEQAADAVLAALRAAGGVR